jgi:hypothetical protein
LKSSRRILIAGAGGGYDFFSGLPLYFALQSAGYQPFIANLTFTSTSVLANTSGTVFGGTREDPYCVEVSAKSTSLNGTGNFKDEGYYPERELSLWFQREEKHDVPIYTIVRRGVQQLTEAYTRLAAHLKLDAIGWLFA